MRRPGDRADAVVIGGGVIGASVAYHLALRGLRDVVVLDRGSAPGSGSTGRATGGFRVQFATAIDVRLSLLARALLERFAHDTGVDPGFEPRGYLWIAENAAELRALHDALAVQHANGADEPRAIGAGDVAALNPALRRTPIEGATYCARDGFIRPLRILGGYIDAAQRLGVTFRWSAEATGFSRARDGAITGVDTRDGTIATACVVNAAGAWAAPVAACAGVALPVRALRRAVACTVPTAALPAHMPMTIYAGDGFHLRVRDGRVLLLLPDDEDADAVSPVDRAWLARVAAIAQARIPALRDVPIDADACWTGLYEMSPDGHAIVGAALGVRNLFLVNGSSGHGVMHAPALGLLLAEIVVDGAARSLDVHALRPGRFAAAQERVRVL